MLSRKGQTTDLELRILKHHHCCVICPVPILSPKTSVPEKSKDAAPVGLLLLCSLDALASERVSLVESDVCRLTAWETRCAVGWRGLRKPECYFWLCQGSGAWPGERHSASPCLCFLSCLYSLHTLQAESSLTAFSIESLLLLFAEGELWPFLLRAMALNVW